MHISLGTAKIGMNYGITSKNKSITYNDLTKIFFFLKKKKINSLDISPLYGNLFKKIKKHNLKKLNITYKIYIKRKNFSKNQIRDQVISDMKTLNLKKFETILIHNAHEINKKKLNKTLEVFKELKKDRLVKKIGISIYSRREFQKVSNKNKIDVIQIPLNIFDQRALHENWLNRMCNKKNIEIQVRSIFLQGILLCDLKKFNNIFIKSNPVIKKWNKFCNNNYNLKLINSINFIKNQKKIKKIIIGFEDLNQLKENYKIMKTKTKKINYKIFSSKSIDLIDPRRWNKNKILI
tara:strand:+ start:335 stop:1213 length:879 start_codon:yes stop_codon:yes gene_type:complete